MNLSGGTLALDPLDPLDLLIERESVSSSRKRFDTFPGAFSIQVGTSGG